jgi:predicted ATPase/DNA-binding CsgD family transcriptional regulator
MSIDEIAAADGLSAVARQSRRARPQRTHTSFVGRDDELATLIRLLRSSNEPRVTITGRSGSGKTRLAQEAALKVGPDLPGGAVFVSLGGAADVGAVPAVVAAALDILVAPGQEPEAAIARELRYMPTLLVVDDADAVAGAPAWVMNLMSEAPETRLLATAAAPLHADGEHVIRLRSLAVDTAHDEADLLDSPAIRLFADRATAVQHDFKLDRATLRSVAELCRRLDGLPLAIELAAARSIMLSPSAQLRLIERSSALDLSSPSSRPNGHRGLREALVLSYGLVGSDEQQILRRMSVFEVPQTLDAIRLVCVPDLAEEIFLDRLTTLVDVHLVGADNASQEPRYGLLPMIREFSREKLAEAGEVEQTISRHTNYFLGYAEQAAGLAEHVRTLVLAADRADIELALDRLVAAGDVRRGSRLVGDLGFLWERYGWFPVAQGWVESLIAQAESDPQVSNDQRAIALIWWARLSLQHPDATQRQTLITDRFTEALQLARDGGSTDTLLLGLQGVVLSIVITHEFAAAAAAAAEGLGIAQAAGNEAWLARFETYVAIVANRSGDPQTAATLARAGLDRALRNGDLSWILPPTLVLTDLAGLGSDTVDASLPTYDQLLATTREIGDIRGEGWVLARLAYEALLHQDVAASVRWTIEGLELGCRRGLFDTGFAIVHLAEVAFAHCDDAAVARLHGSLARIMQLLPVTIGPAHTAAYQAMIEKSRERAGVATFDRIANAAGQLSWDDATAAALDYARRLAATLPESATSAPVDSALSEAEAAQPVTDRHSPSRLTKRELDVVALLATGATNNEIARELGLSPKTVMHHSVSIYAKLGVRGRAEATAWAFRNGLALQARAEA